ncbi:MAG: biopolymer transporter ExbD [Planctomycetes bacterium]|nr:biopolymer transporter ExbD [Planctomycetota bacterium]
MGRFRSSADDSSDVGIDMSAMIDCVFILLIFFIVTTTFVEETGIEVDKPQAASSQNLEKNSILLALTTGGDVIYGGRNIGIQGVQQLVRRMMQNEKGDELPVIVQADTAAPAGMLVRVVDECKLGGAKKVSVATSRAAKKA